MCKDCERNMAVMTEHMSRLGGHISGLVDGLSAASNNDWEVVEILTFGGPQGIYMIHAPFVGDCQYSVVNISSSAACVVCVSNKSVPSTTVSFTTAPQPYQENLGFPGFIFNMSSVQTPVPVISEWANITDSSNNLYMRVDIAASNAAYVTFAFRQKRMVR
jgi:hypothetical protein